MTHTPTPWEFVSEYSDYGSGGEDITFGYIKQAGGEEYHLAVMVNDTVPGSANGEFIVTAVNVYDKQRALIETLTAALEFYADEVMAYSITQVNEPRSAVHGDRGRIARKALAAAKEQSA